MTQKKDNEPKKYKSYADDKARVHIVSEPDMPYGSYAPDTAAMRTIGMMGMNGARDFAGVKSESDFIGVIRTGIPKEAMTHLMEVADLTLLEMANIIHTSDRTLRRYGPHERLSQDQSERMIEMARLYSRGEEVLGSIGEFRVWMDMALLPFGNKKPKEFLDTSLGIGMIMDELGRIQHGIFA